VPERYDGPPHGGLKNTTSMRRAAAIGDEPDDGSDRYDLAKEM
jgi:hypothetical protein